jgi:D-alanyl-D-alanine carboxypeptidase/D-alanyl-D-alanine-endopeptidase (penicillin-binding protein 4)
MLRRTALKVLFAASLACAGAARAELPAPVVRLLDAAGIPQDALGVLVLRGNTTLLSHGAERSMAPASTMKLVTTIVGLDHLGPAFRGRTELRSSAELAGGVLKGDLILRGGADADFNANALEHMLQALRNQGIETIRGDLVIDRHLFRPARTDLGAAPFDESPESRYNVVPDALLLNTNLLQVELSSTGKQLKLLMMPPLEGVSIESDMALTDGPCARWQESWRRPEYVRDDAGHLSVILHGGFPKNCAKSTSINVLDRNDYSERMFRATWRRLGGSFTGVVREVPVAESVSAPAAAPVGETRLLAEHVARALPEVLRDINKISDNAQARLLYLSLGSLEYDAMLGSRPLALAGPDSTAARAEQVVRQWFLRHNIDDAGLVIENGSGLSRAERIRPAQMAALLQAASASLWAPEFLSSLPIAGVDGTMRRRLQDSPAAMRARIKTGALKNVMAIAGYAPDAGNRQCVVVAMINHELAGAGRPALDALIDWVATAPLADRGP